MGGPQANKPPHPHITASRICLLTSCTLFLITYLPSTPALDNYHVLSSRRTRRRFRQVRRLGHPWHDVGQYFKNLNPTARVAKLKEESGYYGAQFFAFNTGGWAKSWTTIDPSMFVKAPGSSLYIRVEFSGWTFYPRKLLSPTFGIELELLVSILMWSHCYI